MTLTRDRRWGSFRRTPLFPCYLFVKLDPSEHYFDVKYHPGVIGFISAGREHLPVPENIISDIKAREVDGIIKLEEKPLNQGERVRILEGPFRDFEAIFASYLSGTERVAILLNAIQASGLRMILPSASVSRVID